MDISGGKLTVLVDRTEVLIYHGLSPIKAAWSAARERGLQGEACVKTCNAILAELEARKANCSTGKEKRRLKKSARNKRRCARMA